MRSRTRERRRRDAGRDLHPCGALGGGAAVEGRTVVAGARSRVCVPSRGPLSHAGPFPRQKSPVPRAHRTLTPDALPPRPVEPWEPAQRGSPDASLLAPGPGPPESPGPNPPRPGWHPRAGPLSSPTGRWGPALLTAEGLRWSVGRASRPRPRRHRRPGTSGSRRVGPGDLGFPAPRTPSSPPAGPTVSRHEKASPPDRALTGLPPGDPDPSQPPSSSSQLGRNWTTDKPFPTPDSNSREGRFTRRGVVASRNV